MTNTNTLSDQEILEGVKNFEEEAGTLLYNKHKNYCLKFMYSKYEDEHTVLDIYQDAVIVLIENVRNTNFELKNTSIQTYLNAICYNQIKVRFNKKNKPVLMGEAFENKAEEGENITDWFGRIDDVSNERIKKIMEELEALKEKGPQCYDVLRYYYFEKKSMDQIATIMNYTNADNAKSQKARCLKNFKEKVLNKFSSC